MRINQRITKLIFLGLAITAIAICGYSQGKKKAKPLTDLTGDYIVKLPALSKDTRDLHVGIIPLDSIGKKPIKWNDNQHQLTQESETEFENELLTCSQGKDTAQAKTIKRKMYCLRQGYDDAAMGQFYEVNYISFKKLNALVIIEFGVMWTNCSHGREGDRSAIKECEKEEASKRIRINAFMNELVSNISFRKVNLK